MPDSEKVTFPTQFFWKSQTDGRKTKFLRSKLFRHFFLISSVLVEALFLILFLIFSVFAKSMIDQREMETASAYSAEIETNLLVWLHNHESNLSFLKRALEIDSPYKNPMDFISSFLYVHTDFSVVFIANKDGSIMMTPSTNPAAKQLNIADREYFQKAQENNIYQSGFFQDRINHEYLMAFSVKLNLLNGHNKTQAVLVAFIPASAILAYLQHSDHNFSVANVFILSNEYKPFTATSDSKFYLPDSIRTCLQNSTKCTSVYKNANKERVYGTATKIQDMGLILVTEISQKKVLKPYTSVQLLIICFAVITFFLLLAVILLLTVRIIKPIKSLCDAAIDIAQGTQTETLQLNTGTELDSIGLCFNFMSTVVSEREMMLREAVARDSLTEIYNHGRVLEFLTHEVHRQSRDNKPISFIMLDIDFFKHVNDEYGHQSGDFVLKEVARLLKNNVRESDILGRYGGEEFAIIISDEIEERVIAFCERIRQKIESTEFSFNDAHIKITVSLGYCYAFARNIQPDLLIRAADHALYTAKDTGRNKVCSAPISSS